MKKWMGSALAALLIVFSPGLPCYRAAAQSLESAEAVRGMEFAPNFADSFALSLNLESHTEQPLVSPSRLFPAEAFAFPALPRLSQTASPKALAERSALHPAFALAPPLRMELARRAVASEPLFAIGSAPKAPDGIKIQQDHRFDGRSLANNGGGASQTLETKSEGRQRRAFERHPNGLRRGRLKPELPAKPRELEAAKKHVRERYDDLSGENKTLFEQKSGKRFKNLPNDDFLNIHRAHNMPDGNNVQKGAYLRGRWDPQATEFLMQHVFAGTAWPEPPPDESWSPAKNAVTKKYVDALTSVAIDPSNENEMIQRFQKIVGDPCGLEERWAFLGLFDHVASGISDDKLDWLSEAIISQADKDQDHSIAIYSWLKHGNFGDQKANAAAQRVRAHIRELYPDWSQYLDPKLHSTRRAPTPSATPAPLPAPTLRETLPAKESRAASPAADALPSRMSPELEGLLNSLEQNNAPGQIPTARKSAEKFREKVKDLDPKDRMKFYRRSLDPDVVGSDQVRELIVDSIGEVPTSMAANQPAEVIDILRQVREKDVPKLQRSLELQWPWLKRGLGITQDPKLKSSWVEFWISYPTPSGQDLATTVERLKNAANAFTPDIAAAVQRIFSRRGSTEEVLNALPPDANGRALRDWIKER